MRYVTVAANVFMCAAVPIVAFQSTSTHSLQVGIQRNQEEIQKLHDMVSENQSEKNEILIAAGLDVTSLLSAGVISATDAAETRAFLDAAANNTDIDTTSFDYTMKVAEILGKESDYAGHASDIFNGIKDFRGDDTWIQISDGLKELLNIVGNNPALAEVGIANNVNDLGIKAAQWWSLDATNMQLEQVLAGIEAAQEKLLAKDPVTQQRLQKAAGDAVKAAQQRQLKESNALTKYYKDHPDLARKLNTSTIVNPRQRAASQISQISGVNPDFIAALNRCNQIERQWIASNLSDALYPAVMTCDKYSDGSYIPAFGAAKGIPAVIPSTSMPSKVHAQPCDARQRCGAFQSESYEGLCRDRNAYVAQLQREGSRYCDCTGPGCDPVAVARCKASADRLLQTSIKAAQYDCDKAAQCRAAMACGAQ